MLSSTKSSSKEDESELSLYTWKDASLMEISFLIQDHLPNVRRKDAKFSFKLYSLIESRGNSPRWVDRDLGAFLVNSNKNNIKEKASEVTLNDFRFAAGDVLDVGIFFMNSSSSINTNPTAIKYPQQQQQIQSSV